MIGCKDMQSLFDSWKKNAKQQESRTYSFLRRLKMRDDDVVDLEARLLHKEIFSIIDCTQCANCCKVVYPTLTDKDIVGITSHLGMEKPAFIRAHLTKRDDEDLWKPKSQPCQFLGADNRCTIYEVRPKACKDYPHTNKKGFAFRTYMHAENSIHCPAVFHIVEAMKAKWGSGHAL